MRTEQEYVLNTMEAGGQGSDPVKLVEAHHPHPTPLVIYYWPFQGDTFIVVLLLNVL